MIERTEELGLAARLPIVVGGQRVELRTLNLDESDKWQAKLAEKVAGFNIPDGDDPGKIFAAVARQPVGVMLDLVRAYDVDGQLGTLAALRKRLTQIELYAAVKQMVRAELPFLEDARSMAEVFGPQLRAMGASVLMTLYQRANSMSLPLPNGDSTQQGSGKPSPKKGSSSSGPTVSDV